MLHKCLRFYYFFNRFKWIFNSSSRLPTTDEETERNTISNSTSTNQLETGQPTSTNSDTGAAIRQDSITTLISGISDLGARAAAAINNGFRMQTENTNQ